MAVDDKSSCAEVTISWSIFHRHYKVTQCSVRVVYTKPVLRYSCKLARDTHNCSTYGVDGSLKPRYSPSSPFFSLLSFRTWYRERWKVTLLAGGRERRQWDSAPLLQVPAGAELQMCMSRGAEGAESCALPACLSHAAENRSSLHGNNILGWSTVFSVGDRNVGLNKKTGFT